MTPRQKKSEKLRAKAILCKGCGIGFAPKDKRQKFHSADCRKKHYNVHYFAKVIVNKRCLNCGAMFPTSKPKIQDYCVADCREVARKKRVHDMHVTTSALVDENERLRKELADLKK